MKPDNLRFVFLKVSLVALALTIIPTSIFAQPFFAEVEKFTDEFGSGGVLYLHADVPGNSKITLQFKTNNTDAPWTDYGPPVLSLTGGPMTFSVPYDPIGGAPMDAFFRLEIEPSEIDVEDDGENVTVSTDEAVPAGLLFAALGLGSEQDFFITPEVDPFEPVGPLKLSAPNTEDLLRKAGLQVWVTPRPKDDSQEAARLPGNTGFQKDRLPPNPDDVGKGEIGDGFEGVPGVPTVEQGPEDPPEPNPDADRELNPKVEPADDFVVQREDPNQTEPGKHIRLVLELFDQGGLNPQTALECPGDALLLDPESGEPSWPINPALNSLVYVVRSPLTPNLPEDIYYIGLLPDPFGVRAYDPPVRGSHGVTQVKSATVRLPLPLLDPEKGLEGMEVEYLRLRQPIEDPILDPLTFLRNENNFESVGQLTGDQILKLISASPQGAGIRPASDHIAPTLTTLHVSGSRASKFNMVVIGDGFRNTTLDQTRFNDYVRDTIMDDLFERDIHPEILNAINVYQINTFSDDSGVTQVNSSGAVTTARDTALQFRYSGVWSRCWMEYGPGTVGLMNGIVDSLVPEADIIAVVLNETGQGGCSRSAGFAVTRTRPWSTFAHEFGHFFGKLGDEYQCNQGSSGCGCYGSGEPGASNLTKNTSRNQIPWNIWIPSWRPVPTAMGNIVDTDQDVGLFRGATISSGQWWNCIYRPSWRGRMNNNSPDHNPQGYTKMRDEARPRQDGDFRKSVVGDFNNDGLTDVVILDGRQLSLYLADERDLGPDDPITGNPPRSLTGVLDPTWYFTDRLVNASGTRSWQIRGSDMLFPGDFNGDGLDDLYVVNLTAWSIPYLTMLQSTGTDFFPVARYDLELPGWDDMRDHDEFYVADFNNDGRDDLMVYNGQDWNMPYFIMLRSTGGSLAFSRRYDRYLPGWEMGRHEKFYVGDFNGDSREEVCSLNLNDWNQVHLMVFRSTGSALALTDRHYGTINFPFWTMRNKDHLYVLDFNDDGYSDLAIFNGRNWGPEYLALLTSNEAGKLAGVRRYEDTIPGWDMERRDRHYVADVDGDGDQDLVVYNKDNWSTQYLGILRSNGKTSLSGSWQDDWIGGWNLGSADNFHVADFRGSGNWEDLYVFNQGWFGLMRSKSNRYQLEAIYRKWIHNHRYHGYGWW